MDKPNTSQDLADRLNNIEITQLRILKEIQDIKSETIPQNDKGVYKISEARTVLFLNDMLPQIYLTLVSVLQGVALAVLIDQLKVVFVSSSLVIYGYAIASFLIVIAFWHSYLRAILDGRWPFRFTDTLLFFLAATFEGLAIQYIDSPWIWCFNLGLMCFIVALIYWRQIWLLNELIKLDLFEDIREGHRRIRGVKILTLYFTIGSLLAFAFIPITHSDPSNLLAPVLAILAIVIYIRTFSSSSGIDAIG